MPRLSRETVHRGMSFLIKLAQMVSSMGYSNLTLTQALAERKRSEEALIRSEKLASVGRMAATVAHEPKNGSYSAKPIFVSRSLGVRGGVILPTR